MSLSCRTLPRQASPCLVLVLPCLSCPHLSFWPTSPSVVFGPVMPWRLVASCRLHEKEQELQEESKKQKEETWELTWNGAPDWRSELVEVSLAWR